MSAAATTAVWAGGILPFAVLCSARLEWERRRSAHEDERRFVRLPAVVGVAGGVVWPVVAVPLVVLGVLWVVGRSGQTVLDLMGVE